LPPDWQAPHHTVHGATYPLADAIAWKEPLPLLSARAAEILDSVAPNCAEYRHFTDISGAPYYLLNVLAFGEPSDHFSCPPLFRRRNVPDILCKAVVPASVVQHGLTGFGFRDPCRPEIKELFLGKDT